MDHPRLPNGKVLESAFRDLDFLHPFEGRHVERFRIESLRRSGDSEDGQSAA
ncbi:hypothetical protein [Natronococcus wangiae]|uniref:hypothetical protein n=1 Tax=Natronococcus wangiae TaxID=3068275 RepID=UPI00273F1103|nr:hypothetical protein [Natronococcus sp. AD5]